MTYSQEEINSTVLSRLPPAWDSTVSIVVADPPEVRQHGSGMLFRIADHFLVVTAAHVIRQALQADKSIGITGSNDNLIATVGEWNASNGGADSTQPFDLAIYRLDASMVDRLSGMTFLRLEDIDYGAPRETDVYALFGFPSAMSGPSTSEKDPISITPFQLVSYAYDGDVSLFGTYKPEYHMLIDGNPNTLTDDKGQPTSTSKLAGKPMDFPRNLQGISGCSVWRIGDRDVQFNSWHEITAKVVGVQTAVFSGNKKRLAIKATLWKCVLTLVATVYPELRPAMDLWRPPK